MSRWQLWYLSNIPGIQKFKIIINMYVSPSLLTPISIISLPILRFLINFKIKIKIDKIDTDKTKLDCIMLHSWNINFFLPLHTLFILYSVEVVTVPFYSFESYQRTIIVIQSFISLLPNAVYRLILLYCKRQECTLNE